MKLYYYKFACSFAVRIILNELGLSYEDEVVDLMAKKTAGGQNYFDINPKGAVPALQLNNGKVLTEVQAILQYLADTNPGHQLLAPVGQYLRYETLEWQNFVSTELHKGMGWFFLPFTTDEMKSNVLLPVLNKKFKLINDRLATRTYLLGEQFTLPDAYLFVMIMWAQGLKIDCSAFPNMLNYFEMLKARPSIAKSFEQEQ